MSDFSSDGFVDSASDCFESSPDESDGVQTPESLYRAAKDAIGIDDNYSIDTFYQIYQNTMNESELRVKSLGKAATCLSSIGDTDGTLQTIGELFECYNGNEITEKRLKKYLQRIGSNLLQFEDLYIQYLDVCCDRIDRNQMPEFYLDMKLKRCELMMQHQDYDQVKTLIAEIEEMISFPIDLQDQVMCMLGVRLMIIKIEMGDLNRSQKDVFDAYKIAKKINTVYLSSRQKGILQKVMGIKMLEKGKYKDAVSMFNDSFRLLEECGSDLRVRVIPYLCISIMRSKEQCLLMNAPEFISYSSHPLIAPIFQLCESYNNKDIIEFDEKRDTAEDLFYEDVFPTIFNKIRHYVLKENIKEFCSTYNEVGVEYIAEALKSDFDECLRICINLIIQNQLQMLLDPETNVLASFKPYKESNYLSSSNKMLDSISQLMDKRKVKITKKLGDTFALSDK